MFEKICFQCIIGCQFLSCAAISALPANVLLSLLGQDEREIQPIVGEAVRGWAELRARIDGFECEVQEVVVDRRRHNQLSKWILKVQRPCLLQHETRGNGQSNLTDFVTARNDGYSFQLEGVSGKDWVVKFVGPADASGANHELGDYAQLFLALPYSVAYEPLPELLKDLALRIVDLRTDGEKATLEFERTVSKEQGYGVRKGTVWFDVAKLWRIDRYVVEYGTVRGVESEVEAAIHYGESLEGRPTIARYEFASRPPGTGEWNRRVFVFNDWKYRPVSEDEFRLPAYGLSEIGFVGSAGSSANLGILLVNVAIVLILLSALIYRRFGAS